MMKVPHNKQFFGLTQARLQHIGHQGYQMAKREIVTEVSYRIDYGGCQRGRYRVIEDLKSNVEVGALVCDAVNALAELELAYEMVVGRPYKFHDAVASIEASRRQDFIDIVEDIWSPV